MRSIKRLIRYIFFEVGEIVNTKYIMSRSDTRHRSRSRERNIERDQERERQLSEIQQKEREIFMC
jgi:hypothetical protein